MSPLYIQSYLRNLSRDFYTVIVGDLSRVYHLLPRKLKAQVWFLFSGMVVVALMEVASISSLAFLGMSVASPESTETAPFFSTFIKMFPAIKHYYADRATFVLIVSMVILGIFLVKNVIQAYVMWRVSRLGELMSLHLGDIMLRRYLSSPYMWHISSDSGRTFNALSARDNMGSMLMHLLGMYAYFLTALALFITLLSATPGAIISAIVATAVVAVAIYTSLKRHVDRAGRTMMLSQHAQSKSLMDAMNGIREVLIYRQQDVFHLAYMKACTNGSTSRSFLSIAPPIPSWILETLGIGVIPLSIWVLIKQNGADMATVTSVISLVMLTSWRILPMVNRALGSLIAVRSLRPQTMDSLTTFEAMRKVPTVELPDPDPDYAFDKSIVFENICFRYPSAGKDALEDITLTIPKGAQVGFIGLSGAGKSTIVGVLSGLMEPSQGSILIDGQPLTKPRLAAYMLRVGYVPQTPYILSGSIAENVAFSRWGREYDREQVQRACQMAALDLTDREMGIDTPVGAGGAGLSGGQAQRVSIARALYCNPELLILDESTSSLDQANEASIMATINNYRGVITTIIVAHRLTTLVDCDYLFWLEGGKLMDQGPPSVLLDRYKEFMRQRNISEGDDSPAAPAPA